MTLKELRSDPKKKTTINWWKVMMKLINIDACNEIEMHRTKCFRKRYRLLCKRCQIERAISHTWYELFRIEQEISIRRLETLVKRG